MCPSLLTQSQGMPVAPVMVTGPPQHPQRPSAQDGGSVMAPVMVTGPPLHPQRPSAQDGGSVIAVLTGPEDQLRHRESAGVKWKHGLWPGLPPSMEVKEEPPLSSQSQLWPLSPASDPGPGEFDPQLETLTAASW